MIGIGTTDIDCSITLNVTAYNAHSVFCHHILRFKYYIFFISYLLSFSTHSSSVRVTPTWLYSSSELYPVSSSSSRGTLVSTLKEAAGVFPSPFKKDCAISLQICIFLFFYPNHFLPGTRRGWNVGFTSGPPMSGRVGGTSPFGRRDSIKGVFEVCRMKGRGVSFFLSNDDDVLFLILVPNQCL